ncbi:DUF1642 domain-containing protein [Streptococcus dysgalactiae]|uniref:DUF1642 domain-containing protein n=1 Tax=Streptococcus dysgalactiae TaxID=1334 RepID=UPI003F76AC64
MNIEEAKQKLHNMAYRDLQTKPYDLKLADVMQILNQIELNQPKPEVPQCVADWYEGHKGSLEYNLYLYQMSIYDEKVEKDDFYYWMQKSKNPVRTLINMHQFGYTVEKEKLYTVEIPNPNIIGNEHTVLMKNGFGQIVMLRVYGDDWRTDKGYQNTESEIRKDFDWAWKEGFMKEVTE